MSALSKDIRRNVGFYTGVLGLRLVKRTVNQEDPTMYHLFYGDAVGSPGSDMTFFDMPMAARERRGNNSITRTTFRANGRESLDYWADRLAGHGSTNLGVVERDGRLHVDFEDPDGVVVSLVDDGGEGAATPWDGSPVPTRHQLRGLGYGGVTVPDLAPTHDFLTEVFNMRAVREYSLPEAGVVHVYEMGAVGPAAEIHVAVRPGLPRARYGAGGVHHIALRVPGLTELRAWAERIEGAGSRTTGVVDRYYFSSLYVREPNGIMFELATDGPGFLQDETAGELGTALALPPFLRDRRAEIEGGLVPLG